MLYLRNTELCCHFKILMCIARAMALSWFPFESLNHPKKFFLQGSTEMCRKLNFDDVSVLVSSYETVGLLP